MARFLDFPYICRFCLKSDNLQPLSTLKEDILLNVKPILSLEEQSSSTLPENMCKVCFDFMESISKFVELIQTNTKKLQSIVENWNTVDDKNEADNSSTHNEDDYTILENQFSPKDAENAIENKTVNVHTCSQIESNLYKNSYKCKTCAREFSRASGLQRHMKIHLGLKPFKCEICGKAFVEKATLSRHNLIHTGEKPFGCSLCGKLTRRKDQIVEHVMKYHPNVANVDFVIYEPQMNKESEAYRDSKSNEDVVIHKTVNNSTSTSNNSGTSLKEFQTKKRVEICQCTLCGKVFQRHGYLKNHMAIHAADKPYKCKICNKGFTQRHALIRHNLVHTKERPFQCNLCGKTFTRKDILTEHIKNHDGNKKHLCFHCGKCFENKYYLAKHLKYYLSRIKGKNDKNLDKKCVCMHCGKQLHSVAYLKVHLLTHSGEKPFECEICGKKFTIHRSLKNHLNIHKGIKPYQCKQCDKSFRTSSSLKKHQFLHTGERPYKCTSCNKGFIRRSHLKRHVRTH